jgi:hypothetical protein
MNGNLFTCDKSTGLPTFARKRGRYRSPATIPGTYEVTEIDAKIQHTQKKSADVR